MHHLNETLNDALVFLVADVHYSLAKRLGADGKFGESQTAFETCIQLQRQQVEMQTRSMKLEMQQRDKYRNEEEERRTSLVRRGLEDILVDIYKRASTEVMSQASGPFCPSIEQVDLAPSCRSCHE